MKVSFWFDPACPFCWMTSRWIVSIAPERELEVDWQPISLLFKNEAGPDHPFFDRMAITRNLLRVVESLRAAGQADRIGAVYTAFGRKIHHEGTFEFDVAAILTELGLDPAHADAFDDERFDATIRSAMAVGLELTGNDVGTPIMAIDGANGRVGLFGPVITEFPRGEVALRLWDGFVAMAETPGFYELKRTRTSSPDAATIDLG